MIEIAPGSIFPPLAVKKSREKKLKTEPGTWTLSDSLQSSALPRPPPPVQAADARARLPVPPLPLAGRPVGVHARASLLFAASQPVSAAEIGLAAEAEAESEPR